MSNEVIDVISIPSRSRGRVEFTMEQDKEQARIEIMKTLELLARELNGVTLGYDNERWGRIFRFDLQWADLIEIRK